MKTEKNKENLSIGARLQQLESEVAEIRECQADDDQSPSESEEEMPSSSDSPK